MLWSTVLLSFILCFAMASGNECGRCISDTVCNNETGHCPYGCQGNFKPPQCKDCTDGWWGDQCERKCGSCEKRAACNTTNGHCQFCESGKQPPRCTDDCQMGTYGPSCSQICSQFCRLPSQDLPPCDIVLGRCPAGCKKGYIGTDCKTVCPRGTAGDRCTTLCDRCSDFDCNATTGFCLKGCVAGYHGPRCSQACTNNTYGENCSKKCECGACDPISGNCTMTSTTMPCSEHSFWLTYKGGLVGSAAVVLFLLTVFAIICLVQRKKRKTHSLLTMHRVQKKLSDTVKNTAVDPETEMEVQTELRQKLTNHMFEESSGTFTHFPESPDPLSSGADAQWPKSSESETPRKQVTSSSSNYVTAVSSPVSKQTSPYMDMTGAERETVNPYESHKYFQAKATRRQSPLYANSTFVAVTDTAV